MNNLLETNEILHCFFTLSLSVCLSVRMYVCLCVIYSSFQQALLEHLLCASYHSGEDTVLIKPDSGKSCLLTHTQKYSCNKCYEKEVQICKTQ